MPTPNPNSFLVRFSASQWTGRKMDKSASRDTKSRANATDKAGVKVYKSLVSATELDVIGQIINAARDEHEKRTVPWAYKGPGAITAEGYGPYRTAMADHETKFYKAVARFLSVYDEERRKAPTDLGTLYNPADYPSVEELRTKFAFSIHVEPFPQAENFAPVGLPVETVAEIRHEIAEHTERAISEANATAWGRVIEHVNKLKTRLDEYTRGDVTKFYDSWVTNITELADLVPSINVANDPELRRMGQKLKMLTAYSTDALKDSVSLRTEVVRQATAILDGINSAYKHAA